MPTGKGAAKAFRIATAVAKKKGFNDFTEGSAGAAERGKIAEQVAAKKPPKKGK